MPAPLSGLATVGTTALPITLGISGSATDVWTYNHNAGRRALMLEFLAQPDGFAIPNASVTKTQPTVNQMVLTNTTGGALSGVLRITWDNPSASTGAGAAATAGTPS